MPIHDQGYRRYGGVRRPVGHGWSVIAQAGIRTMLGKRAFIALLLMSWVPFVVRVVQLYLSINLPQATVLAPNVRMYRQFLEQQEVWLFFITVYAGAGLIANDRRANALQIYLSKPLTRLDYVAGKFAILAAFLLFVTWVPGILLVFTQILLSGSFEFFTNNLVLVPAITVFSAIQVASVGLIMLALSSLSRSSRYVGVLYAGLIFFSQAMYGVLFALTRDTRVAFVSTVADLAQIGDFLFRLPLRFQMPVPVALGVIVLLVIASLWILRRRVQGIEVVT